MKNGYAATSTIEIATNAKVSKRELYAVVGNKRNADGVHQRTIQATAGTGGPAGGTAIARAWSRSSLPLALNCFVR